MATILPPPSKRQRTAVAERAREQQDLDSIPTDLGNIRVQFVDQGTGKAFGAPVSVPVVDATVKNLELLLNTLQQNNVGQLMPLKCVDVVLFQTCLQGIFLEFLCTVFWGRRISFA